MKGEESTRVRQPPQSAPSTSVSPVEWLFGTGPTNTQVDVVSAPLPTIIQLPRPMFVSQTQQYWSTDQFHQVFLNKNTPHDVKTAAYLAVHYDKSTSTGKFAMV